MNCTDRPLCGARAGRAVALALALLLGSLVLNATPAAAAFQDGDLYLISTSYQSGGTNRAVVRIDPWNGDQQPIAEGLPNILMSNTGSYDPYRERLVLHSSVQAYLMDSDGQYEPLGPSFSTSLYDLAPTGDGHIYMLRVLAGGVARIEYFDAEDQLHVLLDETGSEPFAMPVATSAGTLMIYDRTTHALFISDLFDSDTRVRRVPLSTDGARVEGPIAATSFAVYAFSEEPKNFSAGPDGMLYLYVRVNSNNTFPRMLRIDPQTMGISVFAWSRRAGGHSGCYNLARGEFIELTLQGTPFPSVLLIYPAGYDPDVQDPPAVLTENIGLGRIITIGGTIGGTTGSESVPCTGEQTWTALGDGIGFPDGSYQVRNIAFAADNNVYAGGLFTLAGGNPALRIARWDGLQWHPLGPGLDGSPRTLVPLADGTLLVGGDFDGTAGGGYLPNLALWNPTSGQWSTPAPGLVPDGYVRAGAVLPGGDVVLGGIFTRIVGGASPLTVNRVARWDGQQWYPLGDGILAPEGEFVMISALIALPSGDVIIAGALSNAGGTAVNNIARWDGQQWHPLGEGVDDIVSAMVLTPDGHVIVGGQFTTAGGQSCARIARWDGQQWHPLGAGFDDGFVATLAALPNGLIVAGGTFTASDAAALPPMAAWNSATAIWEPFAGLEPATFPLVMQVEAESGALYIGGSFNAIGEVTASGIARWECAWDSGVTAVPDDGLQTPPARTRGLAAPNPFNPRTTIAFDLPRTIEATLTVHDLRGRVVRTLVSGRMDAGRQLVEWDGRDTAGRAAASGVYLVRLAAADGQAWSLKVTLAK